MTDKTRIGSLTEDERNIINFLSADERKAALLIAGRKKMQVAMMTDEQRGETNEQMKRDTMEVTTLSEQDPQTVQSANQRWGGTTDGTQMAVWQQLDGFYGCLQGAIGGNWFEGEDQGPYPLRSDIEEVLRDDYENPEEEADIYPEEESEN